MATAKTLSKRPVATKSTTRQKAKKGKKNSSSPLRLVVGIVLSVVALILLFFVGRIVVDKAFNINAKYGEIVYPEGDVRGIDISHYQEEVDWDRLRNADLGGVPIRFIFIKATEGVDLIDENFNQNFYHARGNGFLRGAYHFFSPFTDPVKQAKHYCRIVQLDPDDIAPILDVEKHDGLSVEQLRTNVIRWMDYVEQHYGATPILYTSYTFRRDYLNTPEFDRYPFWIAHYYVDHLQYKGPWTFWQHSDRGHVDGINGEVDVNVFNGSYEDLLELRVGEKEEIEE